jgi:C1q domain
MGIDIGGNTITQASAVLTVNTGVPMRLLSAGTVVRPSQTLFIARGASAGWVDLANAWQKITTFTSPIVNVANCYDAGLSRFTAPVDGNYYFQVTASHFLKDGANNGYYWHPCFGVNGSTAGRSLSGATSHRLRGYGVAIAGYEDGSIQQIYPLIAGDYVESWLYSNGSPLNRHYPPYQQWSGFLLG